MNPSELNLFLHINIPASRSLNLEVIDSHPEKVVLQLPFSGNCNHHNSVFGGSMALAATLCGWSLMHLCFPEAKGNIVIQESNLRYTKPAHDNLLIEATIQDPNSLEHATNMFNQHGKARLDITCQLKCNDEEVALFQGRYVVRHPEDPS